MAGKISDSELAKMPNSKKLTRRWMHANKPKMAERWEEETPKGKRLPKRVRRKKRA